MVEALLEKNETSYKYNLLARRFIPIEKIARDPAYYGFPNIQPRESRARQGDFLASTKKIVALICANRGGKTEAGVVKFIKNCYDRKGRAWILCPSFELQKAGVQEKLLYYLKPEDIIDKHYASGSALRDITLRNGTIIEFKTYEQGREKLQSAKLITALFDEEPPEEIYREVYTRTVDLQGQIIMTFTPLMGMTFTYKEIYQNPADYIAMFTWGMIDNPFIPIVEIEIMKKTLSYKQAQMRLFGKYMGSESAVYQIFDRSLHIKAGLYNPELPVDITVDFGVVAAAVVFGQVQKIINPRTKKLEDFYIIIDARELYDVGYATMMQQVFSIIKKRGFFPDKWYCDPAGRARQQGSRSGTSLLNLIKTEFGVTFEYMKKLGIEESIEMVSGLMMNANGEVHFYLDGDIAVNDRGDTVASRIENYVRDEETHLPVDDDVVTHIDDCIRYWVANRIKNRNRIFQQH